MSVALLCNPQAGGRWRVLSDVLDSEEARRVHRIVTDDVSDIGEALAGLGQRVDLLCIYGGDGTIFRVINEILMNHPTTPPRLALLGGGTMNVTAAWCGMRRSPGENFRRVMRAYGSGQLLWRETPVLSVEHAGRTQYGFTFGLGPLVRVLERFEEGKKSRGKAVLLGVGAVLAAIGGVLPSYQRLLREADAEIIADDVRVPFDRFSALFANVTGVINPFVAPFLTKHAPDSFNFLAYAVSSREFALMAPLLARALLPLDPKLLLHPVSIWRQALMTLAGEAGIASDPRYVNRPSRHLVIRAHETHYTIDGELFASSQAPFDVRLGPAVHLVTLK